MKKNIILIVFTIVVILNSESYGQIKDLQEIIDRLEPANKASIIAENESLKRIKTLIQKQRDFIKNIQFSDFTHNLLSEEFDCNLEHRIWITGFEEITQQEKINNRAGYNSRNMGFIFGIEKAINNKADVGIALSFIQPKFKYKNSRIGDKLDTSNTKLSIYSSYEFNKFIFDALLSFGRGLNKNTDLRLAGPSRYEIAVGKYKSINWNIEGNIKYEYKPTNNIILVPTIGLGYSELFNEGYEETGTKNQNLIVGKAFYNEIYGTGGIKILALQKINSAIKVIPCISFIVEHQFNQHLSKIKSCFTWEKLYFANQLKIKKEETTTYNIGVNMKMYYKQMLEISTNYIFAFKKKYYNSHQGSLSLKILL